MTKTCLLDYDTIAGADKFGNIFVLRVPTDVSDDIDNPRGKALFVTFECDEDALSHTCLTRLASFDRVPNGYGYRT